MKKNDLLLWIAGALGLAALTYGAKEVYDMVFSFSDNPNYLKLKGTIDTATRQYGLPVGLLDKLLNQESRYRSDIINGTTTSPAGAQGIAQFMPATAAQFGIDPLNPAQAIPAAAKYLSQLYAQFGNWDLAVAAYNWGPGNVAKYNAGQKSPPTETVNYVAAITGGKLYS